MPYFGDFDVTNITDPILTLSGNPADAIFLANFGIGFYNPMDQEVDKFKVDLKRALMGNSELKFGFQLDQREAVGGAETVAFGPYPDDLAARVNDFDTGRAWESNTTNSIGGTYFDNPGLDRAWQSYDIYPSGSVDPENAVAIDEDIVAGYVSYKKSTDWGNYVVGVRVEQTDVTNRGIDGFEYSTDFTDVLPNAHINFDLSDNVKLRLSASSGVNRPTYNEWLSLIHI